MKLPADAVRYLLIGQVLIPIFINAGVNLILVLLTYRGRPSVSIWALDKGAISDFIGTCYLLPAITCLIATPIVRSQVAGGVVRGLSVDEAGRWVRFFCGGLVWRATKFGLSGLILLSGPVFAMWSLPTSESIPTWLFLVLKIIFAVTFGCVATPLIAIVAMTDVVPAARSKPAI